MVIQVILVVAILGVLFLLGRSSSGAGNLALRRLLLLGLSVAAILAVAFPEALTWMASIVGVGRGTDLLLYGLVVTFIASLASQARRAASLTRMITLTTRRLAILEAEVGLGAGGAGGVLDGGMTDGTTDRAGERGMLDGGAPGDAVPAGGGGAGGAGGPAPDGR